MEIASPPKADRNNYNKYIGFEFRIWILFGFCFLSRFIILDYNIWENRGSRKAGGFGT